MLFNYYQLLGIKPTATKQEIKSAYRNLVKKYHPDKTFGNKSFDEQIVKIIEAYAVLINDEKRKNYDLKLAYAANAEIEKNRAKNNQQKQQKQYQRGTGTRYKYTVAPPPKLSIWVYLLTASFVALVIIMVVKYPEGHEQEQILNELRNQHPDISINGATTIDNNNTATKAFDTGEDSMAYYPYFKYFGRGVYDRLNKTTITVVNNTPYEAVVLLVNNTPPYRVTRNHYLKQGNICYMLYIPNGSYFISAYFGAYWDADKRIDNGPEITGAFDKEVGYFQYNKTTDLITANQYTEGKNKINSSYETSLQALLSDTTHKITAKQFWKVSLLQ